MTTMKQAPRASSIVSTSSSSSPSPSTTTAVSSANETAKMVIP
ncbi:unnamed protein product [Rotaria magnacalcarata]|nr:unnamed protein product [Rotaria magnacalcarata]